MSAPQYACKIPLIDYNTPLYDCKLPQLACNIPLPICNIPLSDWTISLYDSKPCNSPEAGKATYNHYFFVFQIDYTQSFEPNEGIN